MSGIEVFGLILGAIPLFISAAEHYRDGLGFVKRAMRKQIFIAKYLDELTQQRTLLLLYLQALVGKTDLMPSVQATLIENPNGATWQNPSVIKALTKELGDAYEPFITLLTTICTTLAKQIRSDDVSTSSSEEELLQQLQSLCLKASPEKADKTEPANIWGNIKFSWKHPERLAMLEELKSYNQSLEKLANAANRAKPYERKQQSRRVHATFELRNDTERLYQALSKACNCRSLAQRTVGLGLAVRQNQSVDADVSFEIAIIDGQNNGHTITVKMSKASDTDVRPPPKKRLKICFTHSDKAKSVDNPMKKLHDLCEEHRLAQNSNCCLQLVIDEKDDLYSTKGREAKQLQDARHSSTDPMLSICDIMTKFKLYDRKRWMHREKAILAVILAYSLLQVHHSSWWQSVWTSESISFLGPEQSDPKTDRNPDQCIRLRRPFTRSVIAEGTPSSEQPSPTYKRNAHLHALGIVLLELFLNRPITDDNNVNSAGSDRRGAAQDLLDEHADDINMTTEYLRAVRFCLSPHPNPYSGSFSFEDKGFREIFYSEVISMLEDNLVSRFEVSDDIWIRDC